MGSDCFKEMVTIHSNFGCHPRAHGSTNIPTYQEECARDCKGVECGSQCIGVGTQGETTPESHDDDRNRLKQVGLNGDRCVDV